MEISVCSIWKNHENKSFNYSLSNFAMKAGSAPLKWQLLFSFKYWKLYYFQVLVSNTF